jgi:hypothetical protein
LITDSPRNFWEIINMSRDQYLTVFFVFLALALIGFGTKKEGYSM